MTKEQILYEDNHLIVLNKMSGQIVQGDKTGDVCMADEIKAYLKVRDKKPGNVYCGVIHRIDRPVSGAVVFAKTSKALARMNEVVKRREMQKLYWAIVQGKPEPPSGTLKDMMMRNEKLNKSYIVMPGHRQYDEAKEAVLEYRTIDYSKGGYSLVEIALHTGRHHQIRCQLANIGCPIKGDLKYGAKRSNADGSISLHAHRLSFEHPVSKERIDIVAPWGEIDRFGFHVEGMIGGGGI